MPKAKAICWAIRGQPHVGFRRLVSTIALMSSLDGPLGPGFRLRRCEKRTRYFLFLRAWWRFNRVEGFSTIAERIRRAGFMNKEHNPATKRSQTRRFGARLRERLRISSCCLRRTDSATTERMPPGRQSRESVTMAWMKRVTRSRIATFYQERQKPEMASLDGTISNSPWTRAQVRRRSCGAKFGIPIRRAAVLTTCHIALDVSPFPHIRPCLFTLRNTFPDVISEALAVHSSIALVLPNGHRHGPDMSALSNEVSDNPVFLPELEIFYTNRNDFGAAKPASKKYGQIARSRFPRSVSEQNSEEAPLPCSAVIQFPIRTPSRFAPLTLAMPAASSGLSSPESEAS